MTVSVNDTIERDEVSGIGPYPYTFRIFAETDLAVTACTATTPEVATPLTYLTHYTVAGANDADGGTITLTAAAAALYDGYILDIRSNTPLQQPTSIRNVGRFLPEIHEDAYDNLSRQIQDLRRRLDAKIGFADNVLNSGTLEPLENWAGRYITINEDGEVEPATLVSGTLSQSSFNTFLGGSNPYKRTLAEINAGITPLDYGYPYGHILRYIPTVEHAAILDGTSSTNCSAYAQNWLDCLTPYMTAIHIGVVRAQGLVLRISQINFKGSGWIKAVTNASVAIITLGEDSSGTLLRGITGQLNIGDPAGTFSSWSNVIGLRLEQLIESQLSLEIRACKTGLLAAPSLTAVAYNTFYLGKMYGNKEAVVIDPNGSGGYCNENTFIGGRFGISSGTYTVGCIHLDIRNNGSNVPNNNRFLAPSFENTPQVFRIAGQMNTIQFARFEGGLSGGMVAGTDFASVMFEFTSTAGQNDIHFGYNQAWLTGTHTINHGGATRVDDQRFDIIGVDLRTHFHEGAWVSFAIGGVTHFAAVRGVVLNGSDTRVTLAATLVSSDPTAVITARLINAASVNTNRLWLPSMNIPTVGNFRSEVKNRALLQMLRSALFISSINANYAALTLAAGNSGNDIMLRTLGFGGESTSQLDANGFLSVTRFGLAGATPAVRQSAVTAPSGGGTIDAEGRTAINAIITRLENFGFFDPN